MINDLKECIFDGKIPDPGPVPTDELRFKVGEHVQCKTDEWLNGIVTETWFREELWETGRYAPYLVLLETYELISIPRDSEIFIKKGEKEYESIIKEQFSQLEL